MQRYYILYIIPNKIIKIMELSPSKQAEAKRHKVPVSYIVMADLLSIGYSELDAYTIAYPENLALSNAQNRGIRENIVSSSKFKALLEHRNGNLQSIDDGGELIDKEQTARLIMQTAMKLPQDSKERIEGLMKYSDLMGYKKDDVEADTSDSITFAFPIKCYQCPLLHSYNEFKKENNEKEIRAVEMERIIRLADGIIKKAQREAGN